MKHTCHRLGARTLVLHPPDRVGRRLGFSAGTGPLPLSAKLFKPRPTSFAISDIRDVRLASNVCLEWRADTQATQRGCQARDYAAINAPL